ncbi:MAG: Tat pathway signal sequence, partial [bacterium]|nr:Tat pathway signal sequence [bacterium]
GYLDVAVSFFHAIPTAAFTLNGSFSDDQQENETDYYYLCVRQKNNHWAWSTPIWVSG